jgi:MFS family permease
VPWASWYGDVVPPGIRGRYFARRARWAHLTTFLSVILAGLLLQRLEPGAPGTVTVAAGGSGYVLIFGIAAGARFLCCLFLAAAPEPDFEGLATAREAVQLVRSEGGRPVRRVLLAASLLMLLVYTASPYFGPFMLQELRFSYIEYTIATTVVVLLKWATLPAWGRAIDRYGARSAYLLAIAVIAIIPLPWIFARGLALVVIGQSLSGFAWGGHEIAYFSLLLESATSRIRPALFAVTNTINGGAQLLGSLLGGALLEMSGAGFRTVFAASMGVRLLLALAMPRVLPADVGRPGIGRRGLLLRMMGFRPNGGLALRPLPVDATPADGDRTPKPREG